MVENQCGGRTKVCNNFFISCLLFQNLSQNILISLCYSHGKGFEEFMCFGEGLHADCVDRERVIGKRKSDYTL